MKTNYSEQLRKLDTEKYYLKELMELVDYNGTLSHFRVLMWKLKLSFKKERSRTKDLHDTLLKNQEQLSNMTLKEIKEFLNYNGSIYALSVILNKFNLKHKKPTYRKNVQKEVKEKISHLGDTTKLSPQDIFDTIDYDIVNPTSFLRRLEIDYKKRQPAN